MLFKGSNRFGVGEAAAIVEGLGGDLNAYTTWDQTVFHATVLADGWKAASDVLMDMVFESELDPDELENEKPVVVEEIHGYADDPESVVDDRLTASMFADHPYARPILGTADSVMAIDRATLFDFWRTHYTTDRCIVVVAGDVSVEDVRSWFSQLDGPRGQPRLPVPPVRRPTSSQIVQVEQAFDTRVVALAFQTFGDGHEQLPALEVLASALGSGQASYLSSRLRQGSSDVADIWVTHYARRTTGTFEIGWIPSEGERPAILQTLVDVLADPSRLSDADIERGRQNLLSEVAYGAQSVEAVAHDIAWHTGRLGNPNGKADWCRQIRAVRVDAVREAATSLGHPQMVCLGTDTPTGFPAPTSARAPRVHRFVEGEQREIQSIYLAWTGGIQVEDASTYGHAEAWASLVATGAGPYDAVGLASALDQFSASLRPLAGRNTFGLQITAPREHIDRAADLLLDLIHRPRFETRSWKRVRDEMLLDLETLDDRPNDKLQRRLAAVAWPDHPWGVSPTKTRLRRTSAEALEAFHHRWIASRQPIVGTAGGIRASTLKRVFASLPSPPAPFIASKPSDYVPRHHRVRAGTEQSSVVLGVRTLPSHVNGTAVRLGVSILGAQSGPLFLNLREQRSLAYDVWARNTESPVGGLLQLGLATSPERLQEATQALTESWATFCSTSLDAAAFDRARQMLLGHWVVDDQNAASSAMRRALCAVYNRPHDLNSVRDELAKQTPTTVQEALSALPEPVVVSCSPR